MSDNLISDEAETLDVKSEELENELSLVDNVIPSEPIIAQFSNLPNSTLLPVGKNEILFNDPPLTFHQGIPLYFTFVNSS